MAQTITGILRRDDADSAVSNYPIGVIPVGTQNKFAKRLLELPRDVSESKFIAEATMAIVNHKLRPADVMEIQIVQSDLPVIVAKASSRPIHHIVINYFFPAMQ